jgi:hypothetical protein
MTAAAPARVHEPAGRGDAEEVGRDVLLLLAAGYPCAAGVDVAVLLARKRRSRLYVVAVVNEPSVGVDLAPVSGGWSREQLRDEALADAGRRCLSVLTSIPEDVQVSIRALCGRPERLVAEILECGTVGALVADGRWSGRRSFRRRARAWSRSGVEVHTAWSPVDRSG